MGVDGSEILIGGTGEEGGGVSRRRSSSELEVPVRDSLDIRETRGR